MESAGRWYENLNDTMSALGYTRNECDQCVFNRIGPDGVQCTAAVHVDDLLIMSKSKSLMAHLVEGYTIGMVLSHLHMVLLLTT